MKHEEKSYELKGATIYLTKQASKVLGFNAIYVEDNIPYFDHTRELYVVDARTSKSNGGKLSTFELSKESILLIEYHHKLNEMESKVRYSEETMITTVSSPFNNSQVELIADEIKMQVKRNSL